MAQKLLHAGINISGGINRETYAGRRCLELYPSGVLELYRKCVLMAAPRPTSTPPSRQNICVTSLYHTPTICQPGSTLMTVLFAPHNYGL